VLWQQDALRVVRDGPPSDVLEVGEVFRPQRRSQFDEGDVRSFGPARYQRNLEADSAAEGRARGDQQSRDNDLRAHRIGAVDIEEQRKASISRRATNDCDFGRLGHDRAFGCELADGRAEAHARVWRAALRPECGERCGIARSESEPAERKAQVARVAKFDADQRRGDTTARRADLKREADSRAVPEPLWRQRRVELDQLARGGAACEAQQAQQDYAEQGRERARRAPLGQ